MDGEKIQRVRAGVCGKCGYHISGTEVRDGAVVCPECGNANPVTTPPPGTRPMPHQRRLRRMAWAILGLIVVFTLVIAVLYRGR